MIIGPFVLYCFSQGNPGYSLLFICFVFHFLVSIMEEWWEGCWKSGHDDAVTYKFSDQNGIGAEISSKEWRALPESLRHWFETRKNV